MLRFDLHVHTDRSDGSTPARETVAFAARRGLSGIAVCDHDTMAAVGEAKEEGEIQGVSVIPAVELSTYDAQTGRKVHLLVYEPQDTGVLEPIFRDMQTKRREAGMRMVELVGARYPVTYGQVERYFEQSTAVYRVHILRALMDLGFASSAYGSLYRELFADPGGCCFVPVDYTDTFAAAQAARRSGGIVVLAHPSVYDSFDTGERLARAGLIDGLEYDYPRRRNQDIARHDGLAQQFDLLKTGGTDFHGFYTSQPHPIGTCTADAYVIGRMRKLLERRRGG